MKYKVGDKVRVKENLQEDVFYGKVPYAKMMEKYKGEVLTIDSISKNYYFVKEDYGKYKWTDEMLEPVEEMSAEEAIKLSADLCSNTICDQCPVLKLRRKYGNDGCHNTKREHTEEYLEILKQWKADHEKKPIETKYVWYVQIIEADTHLLKHEELFKTDFSIPMDHKKEEILKKYCSEHDGKYYAISERRCVVKE